jgi:hypothetical protein
MNDKLENGWGGKINEHDTLGSGKGYNDIEASNK